MYRVLAATEKDKTRAEIFENLAHTEEKHALRWKALLRTHGVEVPVYSPGWRIRAFGILSNYFGASRLLPVIGNIEARNQSEYTGQTEAEGMPADERRHRRTIQAMQHGPIIHGAHVAERWHRTSSGGSLRAAVFGANDGLLSNFSLIMGVAGAEAEPRFIVLAGVAGLLAGAFSMAAGEWISVRSQRELYEQQIALEQQELESSPEEEREELALIYQAKGIPKEQAHELAGQILSNPKTAIETLAREELGLDPAALGSPAVAALSSFTAFAVGALIPLSPYLLTSGFTALLLSATICALALFGVGAFISLFTARGVVFSGLRMLALGAGAAGTTYAIGKLLGVSVAG